MAEKRHKRSHAEVVAAREAYARERHEKLVAKEAKKAERAKALAEREERRKLREARKTMTPEQRRGSRLEERVKKSRASIKSTDEQSINAPWHQPAYRGEIKPGDIIKAYFAGCPVVGEVLEIEYAEDEESRVKVDMYTILVKDNGPYSGMRCPVRKNKIINKYN